MKKFNVALQLYSVRDKMEQDFEGTVQAVAAMGYDGVEFAGMFGKSAAEAKAICEKAGVAPISAHVPFAEMLEDANAVAAYYAELGVKFVTVPWLGEEYRPGTDGYALFKDTIRKLAAALKPYGIKVCYHNHDFEFAKLDGRYLLDIMYADLEPEVLQTQIDTCWARVGMGDPVGYLLQFEGRTPIVHLKDYVGEKNNNMYALIGKNADSDVSQQKSTFEFRPVGYGVQDFPAILAAAEKTGADWVVVEQDKASMDKSSLECAKMSIDYLRTII